MLEEFEKKQWKKDHYKRYTKSRRTIIVFYCIMIPVLVWRLVVFIKWLVAYAGQSS